jgi:hypothetical protein
MQQIQL